MTNVRRGATVALMLATLACGDDSRGPVIPTTPAPNPPPTTGTQPPQSLLTGSVSDTAFRPVAGVRIEAVDGALAGTSAISNATGSFALPGTFDGAVTFRASKQGYVTGTATQNFGSLGRASLIFTLDVPDPPVAIAGDYTLAFTADPACPDLPDVARQRSYPATIAPMPTPHMFAIDLRDPPFLRFYRTLSIGVAGEYVSIFFGGDWGSLAEQLAQDTYLHIEGFASVTLHDPVTTITTPFDGVIEHCVLMSHDPFSYTCPAAPGSAVSRARCRSRNHVLTLTRR